MWEMHFRASIDVSSPPTTRITTRGTEIARRSGMEAGGTAAVRYRILMEGNLISK